MDTVTATDADAGVNAQIKYKIQKGAFDDFSIDSDSGVVKVANHLDFDRRRLYNIEVIAVDGGKKISFSEDFSLPSLCTY